MTLVKKRAELDKALKAPAATRCFLFHGPDEAGSRALAALVGAAAGDEAERVMLTGRELKDDPARLADEAASISLFGGARWVLVEPAGDECVAAVEALLEAPVAGNPVALVAAALKDTSKLLKLVGGDKAAVAFASYLPEGRDAERMIVELGRAEGLVIRSDVAQRIAAATGGNRAVAALELRKFALFVGADADAPRPLEHDAVDLLGADSEEGDLSLLVDGVLDGEAALAQAELARLAAIGTEGITLTRAMQRRVLLLARIRGAVEGGATLDAAMGTQAKSLFWKERDPVLRQARRWTAARLAQAATRLAEAEAEMLAPGGAGPLAAEAELLAICRHAAQRR